MRSVELSLSTTLSDPLYSMTVLPTRTSLLDIETTKSPFSRNSPLLFDKAADEKRELGEVLPKTKQQTNKEHLNWQGLAERRPGASQPDHEFIALVRCMLAM